MWYFMHKNSRIHVLKVSNCTETLAHAGHYNKLPRLLLFERNEQEPADSTRPLHNTNTTRNENSEKYWQFIVVVSLFATTA